MLAIKMHDFEAVLPALRAARCLAEHAGRAAPAAVVVVSLLHLP